MRTLVVIPARYGSTRFPGKPLALLQGKPMIEHVVTRALLARRPDRVIVATDDRRIADALRPFDVVFTSSTHPTGSDRVAEAAALYPAPLVVNLQGDLPLFRPPVLDRLIEQGGQWIEAGEAEVVTLAARIDSEDEFFSQNTVKLVQNGKGEILYFSRSPIPFLAQKGVAPDLLGFKHFGVYLYHKDFLMKMAKAPQGMLERREGLEQLRFLEAGGRIRALEISAEETKGFCEVNVPDDLLKADQMLQDEGK